MPDLRAVMASVLITGTPIFNIVGSATIFGGLLFTRYYWVLLLYLAWQYYDRATPYRGGRTCKNGRKWRIFKWMASYFPAKLHRVASLPEDRNYLFVYHPHGPEPYGAIFNLMTDAGGFSEQFPGLTVHPVTMNWNFLLPFYREIMMNIGAISAERKAITYCLDRRNGVGNAIILVVGGLREMGYAYSEPGKYVFVLKTRRGFARLALEQGASLVPVIGFGDVDLIDMKVCTLYPPGSLIRRFQDLFVRLFRLPSESPIMPVNYILKKRPLNTVVGEPIHVERVSEPTEEQVVELHARYIQALTNLFETNKMKFGLQETDSLKLV